MKTFRLWLEPDSVFSEFRRLRWEMVDVPLEDVLMRGIHPWSGPDKHLSLVDEFMRRFNEPEFAVADLEPFGYWHELLIGGGRYPYEHQSRFERALRQIREEVCFVDGLSYLKLLDMAKEELRRKWGHALVMTLLRQMYFGFPDLRQFLKTKEKSLKLSGYDDLDKYDLGRVLSLEDFQGQDNLVIATAMKSLNFRRASFLGQVTDAQGRLRLVPEIRNLTLTEKYAKGVPFTGLAWMVSRSGSRFRCCPDIGGDFQKRDKAKMFARTWRSDDGEYCFETGLAELCRMVEAQAVEPSFPGLNYRQGEHDEPPSASITVAASRIQAYHIGRFPTANMSGEYLKEVLRHYGVPMTGNKEALAGKLAKLAAEQYRKHRPTLDEYFSAHRFIRTSQTPAHPQEFPLLRDAKYLQHLVLAVYLLMHLRGSAIVDAGHLNDAYSDEDAANALIAGKVAVCGGFVRAT